jgi:hypothetical protein
VLPYGADIPDFCDFFSPGAQDISSSRPFFDQNYHLRQVRSPQAELPLPVFRQVVLPSWMIFKSEMVGLNDRAAPEFCNMAMATRLGFALNFQRTSNCLSLEPAAKERF